MQVSHLLFSVTDGTKFDDFDHTDDNSKAFYSQTQGLMVLKSVQTSVSNLQVYESNIKYHFQKPQKYSVTDGTRGHGRDNQISLLQIGDYDISLYLKHALLLSSLS